MSKLHLLGIDAWPVADKMALFLELSASLPQKGGRIDSPPRRDALRRRFADDDGGQPWREEQDELGGEG